MMEFFIFAGIVQIFIALVMLGRAGEREAKKKQQKHNRKK